jgi:hypothetical protein
VLVTPNLPEAAALLDAPIARNEVEMREQGERLLALGARAVLIGRPVVWGLGVHGADGVRDVLTHLRGELARTMALCGVARIADATPDLVTPTSGRERA